VLSIPGFEDDDGDAKYRQSSSILHGNLAIADFTTATASTGQPQINLTSVHYTVSNY
jgi:hypothetical protein